MKHYLLGGAALALALSATAANAQDAAAPAPATVATGDIVVTATRQSTMLSKTPIAMTAVTSEGLRNAGVSDSRSLAQVAPNLAITESGDGLRIAIRGVTSTDGTEKGDPSAAFLLDGNYIARPQDQSGAFYDIDRVEVLRGPQGTLYGRNTTAGVVNVISALPKAKWEGSVDAKYGNLNSQNLSATINAPVGEHLGVRLAANYDRQNNNVIQNIATPNSVNPGRKVISQRLSFGGELGNLKFVIRGDHSTQRGSMTNMVPVSNFYANTATFGVNPTYIAGGNATALRSLNYAQNNASYRWYENEGLSADATYALTDTIDVTYVGAYRWSHHFFVRDDLLFGTIENPSTFWGEYHQNSQELRVAFGKGEKLHGQVGGYYFDEVSHLYYGLGNPLSGIVSSGYGLGSNATAYAFPQGPTEARSKAGFGQLTYDALPGLHLTAGVRYTNDMKSRQGSTILEFANAAAITSNTNNVPCVGKVCTLSDNSARRSYSKLTWRAGIDYDVPGYGLAYGSVSTGYKAGGFNDGCLVGTGGIGCTMTLSTLYYNPETLTAYEAGIKFKFLNNLLRFNASAFHYDYNNLQLSSTISVNGALQTFIQNAGKAKVDGIETDLTVAPTANDRINVGVNYTDAHYSQFNLTPTFSWAGRALDHAPKLTANVGINHTVNLSNDAHVELALNSRFSSAYYIADLTMGYQFRQPNFTKTDATVTYKAPGNRYYVQAYLKNLENNITVAAANADSIPGVTLEESRTYGIRGGVKF